MSVSLIGIRCGYCVADVCAGGSVLRNSERRAVVICEHRCIIGIRDVDSDNDGIELTIGISRADGEIVVRVLRFIIQGCVGFQLPCVGINAKRCSIGPAQRIGQCIAFRIRRLEGIVDGCADGYVLHNGECDLSLRESWWFIDIVTFIVTVMLSLPLLPSETETVTE